MEHCGANKPKIGLNYLPVFVRVLCRKIKCLGAVKYQLFKNLEQILAHSEMDKPQGGKPKPKLVDILGL